MSRYITRGLQIAIDLAVLSIAYWLAFLFRFEFAIPRTWIHDGLLNWGLVVGLEYLVLLGFGVPRDSWRYVSLREMMRIGFAVAAATTLLVLLRLELPRWFVRSDLFILPFGVLAMNGVLGAVALISVRTTRRIQGEARERARRATQGDRIRVLLVGAGQAGVMVARELSARPDLRLDAVGFLDDDPLKVGTKIGGLTVFGTTAQIAEVAERKRAKRVLITIASAPGAQLRQIAMRCADAGLDTKIIPGIYEIVGDRVNLSRIRDVAIEDLLGREPAQLDTDRIAEAIRGRVVLVTGAGGSIGSELARQVARFAPARLVLVERFENALFEIHRELVAAFPELVTSPFVADICDQRRMDRVFAESKPSIVFHAAAHKHVPVMELNPGEAVKNNIGGTRAMAELADRHGVGEFVLVSTDKAVNPSSVMGATKRVAEIVCQAYASRSRTRFITVRFGNVLGSNGSVIPIFKEQIARGGPVTVTHPEMSRYFMTIPEAAQLVMQAGTMGQGGEIFILDMGKPVKIVDLAVDLITLSGLRPREDIDIVFTGARPGEKLFEELATGAENADKTKHPKIFIGRIAAQSWSEVGSEVSTLVAMADSGDGDGLRKAIARIVPEYRPQPPAALPTEAPVAGDDQDAQPTVAAVEAAEAAAARRTGGHPIPIDVVN